MKILHYIQKHVQNPQCHHVAPYILMGENNKSLSYDFILGQKYKALQDRPLKFMSRYLDLKQSMQTNFFFKCKKLNVI